MLEAFAVLFTSGVAAEQIGFSSVGKTFCSSVKTVLPFLVPFSGKNHYQNLFQLFQMWELRIEQNDLLQQQRKIVDELSKTQTINIKPLGT
jgi:hypothetical protein